MAVQISYNGSNPFGTRTPTVNRDFVRQDVNGYISGIDRFTLTGIRPRPVCPATFEDFHDDLVALLAYFRLQFKEFKIIENGVDIYSFPAAKVVSISVPQNSFSGFYTYEIVIDCIDDYLTEEITNPVSEWNSSEGEDGMVTLTHTVSASGIGLSAFEKARNFVLDTAEQFSGYLFLDTGVHEIAYLDDDTTPIILDSFNRKYALISRRSVANRMAGEFSMTQTWVYDPANTTRHGVITYQTSVAEGPEGYNVQISGNIQVQRIDALPNEIIRAKETFDTIDFQAVAQSEFALAGGVGTLSDIKEFSVNETPDLGTVDFTLSWNSHDSATPYLRETSTVNRSRTGGPTCFTYSGTIQMNSGCAGTRFDEVKEYFEAITGAQWDAKVLTKWSLYGTGERLNGSAKSKSVTYNPFSGEITYAATYCAEFEIECGAVENFRYTMNWTPSIQKYAPDPIVDATGYYNVQDLGYKNRQSFSLSGSARRVKCFTSEVAMGEIRARANLLMNKYFIGSDKILMSNRIEEDRTGDFYSFEFSWSAKAN